MERAAQLMKAGGVAGIVLPVSVLNKGGIYAKAREIILENFHIVSLVDWDQVRLVRLVQIQSLCFFVARRLILLTLNITQVV